MADHGFFAGFRSVLAGSSGGGRGAGGGGGASFISAPNFISTLKRFGVRVSFWSLIGSCPVSRRSLADRVEQWLGLSLAQEGPSVARRPHLLHGSAARMAAGERVSYLKMRHFRYTLKGQSRWRQACVQLDSFRKNSGTKRSRLDPCRTETICHDPLRLRPPVHDRPRRLSAGGRAAVCQVIRAEKSWTSRDGRTGLDIVLQFLRRGGNKTGHITAKLAGKPV